MTRLDQRIALVRSKLALNIFLTGLGWSLAGLAGAAVAAVLFDRLFSLQLPHPAIWFWSALGAAVIFASLRLLVHRPSSQDAALAIDEHLFLKEKFSTALCVRNDPDPFAAAVVADAEATAVSVNLHGQFPVRLPRSAIGAAALAAAALLLSLMHPLDLFGRTVRQNAVVAATTEKVDKARKAVQEAEALVEAAPAAIRNDEQIKEAKAMLQDLLKKPIEDPDQARRSALAALEQVKDAIKNEIEKNQQYAEAHNDQKLMNGLANADDKTGPVSQAQNDIKKGQYDKAVDDIKKAVDNFDKMSDAQKQQTAQQMQNLAKQLNQVANNPQIQQQVKDNLQQLGATAQQAQQIQNLMQQSAQGNPQAQQQLQQQLSQLQQQMNNGQGPTQQQQQQISKMMSQMQAQMNSQAQAQQLASAAQTMAQGMQQAAGQPSQSNQSSSGQGQASQGSASMQQGQAQMQQTLSQMQAVASDAQSIAAAQQAAADSAAAAASGLSPGQQGGQGQGQGQGKGQGQGQGQWGMGQKGQGNGGAGNNGQGGGFSGGLAQAPYTVKTEMDPSQENAAGKVLAVTMIKADQIKGESKAELRGAVQQAQQDTPDDVEQEGVSGQSQKVVKDYFSAIQHDTQ